MVLAFALRPASQKAFPLTVPAELRPLLVYYSKTQGWRQTCSTLPLQENRLPSIHDWQQFLVRLTGNFALSRTIHRYESSRQEDKGSTAILLQLQLNY